MKKILFLIPLVFFLVTACRSSDEDLDNATLVGRWNWLSTDGGIANNIHETPTSTGKTVKLTFTADNNYKVETNGNVAESGTYSLYKMVSNLEHMERVYIHFSGRPDQMIRNNDGTNLYLSDDANDGVETHYQKQ